MDFVVIFFCILLVLALFNPLFGLYAFFIVAYARPQDYSSFISGLEPAKLILIFTFISFVFFKMRDENGFVKAKQNSAILGLLLAIFLSGITALSHELWWSAALDFVIVCLIYFIMVNVLNTQKRLKCFFVFFLLLNFFIAFRFYIGYKFGLSAGAYYHGSKPGTDTFGFLGNADDFGLGMVMALPLALIPVYYAKKVVLKTICMGISLFFILSALGSQSRGSLFGVFAVLVGAIIFSLNKEKLSRNNFKIGLVMILVLFSLFYYKYRWAVSNAYTTVKVADDPGRVGRDSTWGVGKAMVKHSPIIGIGRNNYVAWWKVNYAPGAFGYQVAHNIIIEVVSETGIVGLYFFLFFSLYGLREIRFIKKKYSKELDKMLFIEMIFAIYTLGLLGFYLNGMSITVAFYWHIYVLVAMFVSARNIFIKEIENGKNKIIK